MIQPSAHKCRCPFAISSGQVKARVHHDWHCSIRHGCADDVQPLSTPGVSKSESIDGLEAQFKSVDIDAFLTLIDRRDTEFLRQTLQPAAFRRLHRLRTRAALKYLQRLFSNVSILLQVGELASHNGDAATAEAGRVLSDTALRTRLLILRAYLSLVPHLAIPMYSTTGIGQLFYDYSEMGRQLARLMTFYKSHTGRLSPLATTSGDLALR